MQKVKHQIFNIMEKHFEKLIKIVESCETSNQINVKFIDWSFKALDDMKIFFNDEDYEKKVIILAKTLKNKSKEIYAQTNNISGTGSIG